MRMTLKHCAWVTAVAVGIGIGGSTAQAVAAPYQDRAPDYSNYKTYKQGVREGQDDMAHKRDHSKKRHFKKDEDQKAYEAGYQKGRGK